MHGEIMKRERHGAGPVPVKLRDCNKKRRRGRPLPFLESVPSPKSVFEKWFAGSTGDPPVLSGDAPDGTGATVRANGHGLFATLLAAVLVGGTPTGAGGSPAPPIFKTGLVMSVNPVTFIAPCLAWVEARGGSIPRQWVCDA